MFISLQPKEMVLGFDVLTQPPTHPWPKKSGLQQEDWGQSQLGTWICFDSFFRTRVLNLRLQKILKTLKLHVRFCMNGSFCLSLELSSDFQRSPSKVRILLSVSFLINLTVYPAQFFFIFLVFSETITRSQTRQSQEFGSFTNMFMTAQQQAT